MGRWDDGSIDTNSGKKTRDWIRIARYAIYGGFAIVAIVILLVFIPRAGLSVEIFETGETLKTISIKINNNNPQEIHNISVQFDEDKEKKQFYNSIGPFSSIYVTPDKEDLDFQKIIVTADNGKLQTTKYR
ncbi:MAG: hypothetical protein E6K94_05955 [Thaumarchaeota archaeon]|nr:MAG: hypothetical protein E6L03_06835 [Nitrososphaerota archaeon]TLX90952.1 MAG: hypothetical protein E6K94_05955 [Nitrososphaerota archaeon]